MTALAFDRGLKHDGQEVVISQAARTHAGMAHFAGTGPAGTTCSKCRFWQDFGTKKIKARCRKYQDLMLRAGPEFPGATASCKHFKVRG